MKTHHTGAPSRENLATFLGPTVFSGWTNGNLHMTNKIAYFPVPTATKAVARSKEYKSTNWVEVLIVIWFCGWATLTAVECIRQISSLAI
ncbi:MAG TPA: hypothetical protein VE242_14955 [Chthoniobacterales bacterium]|nr:hypothetical protein [Chthoniobacterales bacterium]